MGITIDFEIPYPKFPRDEKYNNRTDDSKCKHFQRIWVQHYISTFLWLIFCILWEYQIYMIRLNLLSRKIFLNNTSSFDQPPDMSFLRKQESILYQHSLSVDSCLRRNDTMMCCYLWVVEFFKKKWHYDAWFIFHSVIFAQRYHANQVHIKSFTRGNYWSFISGKSKIKMDFDCRDTEFHIK